MARKTEQRFQALFGNRLRINEIDPRFITRAPESWEGIIKLPGTLLRLMAKEAFYECWRHTKGRGKRVHRPVLMVGMPHSGTTISMRLVAQHPDVINKSEANVLWQPLGYFDYENGDHVRTAIDATEAEINRLHNRLEFHRWFFKKPRILSKNPDNTVRLDFLKAVFPDACFIHVIRDCRAVVNSLIRSLPAAWETEDRFKPWRERVNPFPGVKPPNWRSLLRDDPIEQHALQWREVLAYAFQVEEAEGLDVFHLKYEELCEDPRSVMEAVYRFCGLEISEDILNRLPEKLENRNYKWRNTFTEDEVNLIDEIAGPMLTRLGYAM